MYKWILLSVDTTDYKTICEYFEVRKVNDIII